MLEDIVLRCYGIQCILKGYRTTLNHFELVKYVLLHNKESEAIQIHMTDILTFYFIKR